MSKWKNNHFSSHLTNNYIYKRVTNINILMGWMAENMELENKKNNLLREGDETIEEDFAAILQSLESANELLSYYKSMINSRMEEE